MHKFSLRLCLLLMIGLLTLAGTVAAGAQTSGNLLQNPTFDAAETTMPPGWQLYGSLANGHRISVVDGGQPATRALLIEDNVDIARGNDGEIGLTQAVSAGPGRYKLSVKIGAVAGETPQTTALQLRFQPSNEFEQIRLTPTATEGFDEFSITGVAPEGTTSMRVYLYTFASGTPKVRVQSITLQRITEQQADERLTQGIISGYPPLAFDLSEASPPSPPLAELRARIPQGRPRLFATPDTIDALRRKPQGAPLAGIVLNNIRNAAFLLQTAPMPPYPPDAKPGGVLEVTAWREGIAIASDVQNRLDTLAFYYLLSGDKAVGEAGKKLLLHVSGWDPLGNSGRAKNDEISMRLLYAMSRAYDWLHPLLSDAEKTIVQQAVRARGNDVYVAMRARRFEDDLYDNHLVRTMGFLGQAAMAFMGDFPEADVWFDYIVSLFLVKYPSFGDDEGGWSQGVSYWQGYISWVFEFMDALKIATGLDLYEKPFFRNTGYFKLYAHPPKSKFGAFGDHSDEPPDIGSARVVGQLALVYQDAALQWYVNAIAGSGRLPEMPMNTFIGYVRAPTIAGMPPMPALPADFPQSRLFSDVGWAIMNNDMDDWNNNVHIKFKSSPYGSFNHSHAEQNSFQIEAYGSPLAIPSGYYPWYGSPHHVQWTWESKSKNTVVVNGRGQNVQSMAAKGSIDEAYFGAQFDYVLGDATPAYMGRVGLFERQLLFIKPNLILVFDKLNDTDRAVRSGTPFTYDWMLHSVKDMSVDEANNRVLVTGTTAHMWVDFVAPASLRFQLTDQFPIAPEERHADKPNQWHLTATAESTDGQARFIAVMSPRPNARRNDAPPITEPLPAGNGHAARIEHDGTEYVIAWREDDSEPVTIVGTSANAAVYGQWQAETAFGWLAVQATSIHDDGPVLEATQPVTLAVRWEDGRLQLQIDEPQSIVLRAPFTVTEVEVNGKPSDDWRQIDDRLHIGG